jgi:hypothetical protein
MKEVIAVGPADDANNPLGFNEDLIKKYPKANKKITLDVMPYTITDKNSADHKAQSSFISPFGLEFQATRDYPAGTLLKIHVTLPDYWNRKQKLVDYQRIDQPDTFKILAKVVRTEDVGKRGKKKLVVVQTVNMDEVDEKVLKTYLQES